LVPRAGLTTAEARRRLADVGPNTVPEPPPPSIGFRVGRQLTDPLVMLMIAAAVTTTLLRDFTDTAVIMLVIVVNTVIGVAQEWRADRAVGELNRLAAPTARVVRDGADRLLPAADLVPDDRVRLDAGDVVPADIVLDHAERLRLDEAALTGESVPVTRAEGEPVSAGTVVVGGRGAGIVVRTGRDSALGRIASLVAATRPGPTPLQRRLARLGRALGVTVVGLSLVVLVIGLLQGRPLVDMVITAVSLVVAAVPESLPAVVTLALALGAHRMARRRAIARRLHAVETLGSVTVVASDKTGTVTQGRMAVETAVTPDGVEFSVHGDGYTPDGSIHRDGRPTAPPTPLIELARAGALCNDAVLIAPDGRERPEWTAVGDPLEAALLAFAARCGVYADVLRRDFPRLAEQPFDAGRRRMTTVHRTPDGGRLVVCKGAPEAVLSHDVLDESPEVVTTARQIAARLADGGLRVLVVAAAERWELVTEPDAEHGLRLLGLLGLRDPLRAEAPGAARAFDRAGIRLVLITGDHPATAAAIAGQLGMGDGAVVRGDDGSVDPDRADQVRVYARTRPDQKLDIVTALQRRGHVVAMTGDGVNDAPALRRADIGVAMGRSGTEVARQASDLVLVDDNLATMAAAVQEGRRVYDNIRRFLRYGLAGGFAEILVMLAGPFLGLAVPLLPAQILWVNLLTHGLPGVVLGAEPAAADAMRRPPRPPGESVLGAGLTRAIAGTGVVLAATVLGVAVWAQQTGRPWQSMLFMVLGLGQLGIALAVREPRAPGEPGNPLLLAAVTLSGLLQLAGVAVEPLRTLLGTRPLGLTDFAICALAASLPGFVIAAGRRIRQA
jgi:Ca2+-transporting ATPase